MHQLVIDSGVRHHAMLFPLAQTPALHELYAALRRETITDESLLTRCRFYEESITNAIREWEIVRLAARAVGLDLPPGRLWLVQGIYS